MGGQLPLSLPERGSLVNRIHLLRQIYQGKWLIHYSYAMGLGPILEQLLTHKEAGDTRDWRGDQTDDLEENKKRAKLPRKVSADAGIISIEDFNQAPEDSIAIVPLKGTMIKYGDICQYGTMEIADLVDKATGSNKISGIVLDIDSGGGAVDAIPPLLQAIDRARAAGMPVLASADMCGSAAYFVACHCDVIIANNDYSAEFGCIGTMMQFWDVAPYYERQGFKLHTIYAPESNYKNLPFEKALKGDYDLIKQEELSPLAVAFQNHVKSARGDKLNLKVKGILNGRTFYAKNASEPDMSALTVGLIDDIGDIDYAVGLARMMAKMNKKSKAV
jgi:protease-4